jgi:cytochrome c peroxidase
MNEPAGSLAFFKGNAQFLTRKLWGTANEPPFFHHGRYTTLREAVLAHGGEAAQSRTAFRSLPDAERDAVIEFLKSLQVLPPGTASLVIDERGQPRTWSSTF